jgi:hypothetical protein
MDDVNENQGTDGADASVVDESTLQADPVESRIKGMQSEYSRKLENMNSMIAEQSRRIEELLRSQSTPQPQPSSKVNLKDLVYDNPDQFVDLVVQRAAQVADERVNQKVELGAATQGIVLDMQSKYSEFAQAGSEASKLAVEKARTLPKHLQNTPEGIRLAMMDAVAELGLVPASKKQQRSTDDFTLSGSTGSSSQRAARSQPKSDVSQATLDFAALLGVPTNDPKRVEGLKKASQRKNWLKYEE